MSARLGRPPLNVQPLGLLDAFAIKNGGQYPQALGTELGVELELNQWFDETNGLDYNLLNPGLGVSTASSVIFFTGSSTGDLPTSGGGITVPNNEVWMLCDFSARYSMSANAGAILASYPQLCIVQSQGAAASYRVLPQTFTGALTSDAARIVGGYCAHMKSTYLKPADTLAIAVPGFTVGAASLSISGQARIRRFRI